jgi:hypothetical protein
MANKMKIALDWDGTCTADPELWIAFASLAKARGHEVTIVTGRSPAEKIKTDLPVIYCSRTAKRGHFQADVWIDDEPQWIGEDQVKK